MTNRRIGDAIMSVGISPNESDRNGEDANVVDALFAIARSIDRMSSAIEGQEPGITDVRFRMAKGVAEHMARAVADEFRRIP